MKTLFSFPVLLLLVLTAGCKKDDPVVGPPPGGGGGGGGTVSDSVRLAALRTFETFANGLNYSDPGVYATILQYFRSHPETYEASDTTGPKSLWARFRDGRLFIIADNTEPGSDTTRAAPSKPGFPGVPPASPLNLPPSTRARLLNGLGSAFEPFTGGGAQATVNTIRGWLTTAGYTEPISGDASVEGLKQVSGDGVFYFSSHGSWGRTRDTNVTAYGIWTTDTVSSANEARYATDLNSNPPRLCWYRALDNNNFFGPNRVTHYAITPEFVRHHMSFGTNSLVFFNACLSDQADFKAACIAKNAGVYVGWTNNIDAQKGFKAARFLFDRLLGTNQAPPLESPLQRPFEITYVLEDMLLRDMDSHVGNRGPTTLVATPPYGYGGEPTLLAPTALMVIPPFIEGDVNMWVDGSFGGNPGTGGIVTLNNNGVAIASWTPGRIECPPPESGGNLVVKVRGIRSNPIQLTEWRVQFTMVYRGRGSLTQRVVLNVNFWADVHPWRLLPNKPVTFGPAPRHIRVMGNSTCTYEASGVYRSTLDTAILEQWSNAVVPPFARTFTGQTYFGLSALIDSIGRQTWLNPHFAGLYTRYVRGAGTTQETFRFPGDFGQLEVSMASGYVLPAGTRSWSGGENSATLSWNAAQPTYPPNPGGGW